MLSEKGAPASARGAVDAVSSSRLVLLDGLRGYLLVAMFIAHFCTELDELGLFFWASVVRHSRRLPVGEVEFFLSISGFVVALSYFGIHARLGRGGLWRAVGRRWRWIYFYQVVVTVMLVLLAAAGFPGIDLRQPAGDSTLLQIGRSFTLAVQPQNADILVLNLVLLPLVPPAFALLARGRGWLLGALLLLAWGIAATGIDKRMAAAIVAAGFDWHRWFGLMGHFNPLSYALLFFAGFWLGYRFKSRPDAFRTGGLRPRAGAGLAAIGILGIYLVGNFNPAWRDLVGGSDTTVSPHAILVTACVFYGLFWLLAAPAPDRITAAVGGAIRAFLSWPPLLFFGSNSLFVYACHVVVIALCVAVVMAMISTGYHPGQMAMLAVAATGLALLYIATKLKRRHLPFAA